MKKQPLTQNLIEIRAWAEERNAVARKQLFIKATQMEMPTTELNAQELIDLI